MKWIIQIPLCFLSALLGYRIAYQFYAFDFNVPRNSFFVGFLLVFILSVIAVFYNFRLFWVLRSSGKDAQLSLDFPGSLPENKPLSKSTNIFFKVGYFIFGIFFSAFSGYSWYEFAQNLADGVASTDEQIMLAHAGLIFLLALGIGICVDAFWPISRRPKS